MRSGSSVVLKGGNLALTGNYQKAMSLGRSAALRMEFEDPELAEAFAHDLYYKHYERSRMALLNNRSKTSSAASGAFLGGQTINEILKIGQTIAGRNLSEYFKRREEIGSLVREQNASRATRHLANQLIPGTVEYGLRTIDERVNDSMANDSLSKREWWEKQKLLHSHRMLERSGVVSADKIARAKADANALGIARGESASEGADIADIRRYRNQRAADLRRQAVVNRWKPKAQSTINRAEQAIIAKGVQDAFGGKSSLLGFMRGFGVAFGAVQLGKLVKFLAYGNALDSAKAVYQTHLGALATGATFDQIRGTGNVARIFGGSEKDATQLYATINALTRGALVGKGLGNLGNVALRYGLDITGSGEGGLATPEELVDRIADLLASYSFDPGMQAQIAQDVGLSASMLEAMKGGAEQFHAYMKEHGSKLSEERKESLEELNRSIQGLSVEWDTFKQILATSEIVKYWVDKAEGTLKRFNKVSSLGDIEGEAATAAGYEEEWGIMPKVGVIGNGKDDKDKAFRFYDYLQRSGRLDEWIENNSHLQGVKEGYDLYMQSKQPITSSLGSTTQQSTNTVYEVNIGDITTSTVKDSISDLFWNPNATLQGGILCDAFGNIGTSVRV